MLKQKLADALVARPPDSTVRDVRLPAIPRKALAVVGMRRVGKSTLLWQQLSARLKAAVPRDQLALLSFEDERLSGIAATDLSWLWDEYCRLVPSARDGRSCLFLDEIQVVPGWETFVRRLIDTEPIEIFLSGWSASLLSRELATAMRGRAMEICLYPFSFREYLRHHGQPAPPDPRLITSADRSELERHFREFLRTGGFPEAQGLATADRIQLLQGYVQTTVLRDVAERYQVSNLHALRLLARQLLSQPAALFSVQKVFQDFRSQGVAVGKDTLHQMLGYLEDAFLVATVPIEAASERKRQVNPRKAYPVDPGLIAAFDRTGRANTGQNLETAVLVELLRRRAEIAYVRTPQGFEVDFLARYPDGRRELIQVCADLADTAMGEREFRALADAALAHPETPARLLTLNQELLPAAPPGVLVQPAYEWLLTPPAS
ncbi:MAG: ATP-binding protein [Limisphaerales bacterium]